MLKVENIEVTGWEAAIRGMRNPMNSWEKSDSLWFEDPNKFILGDADLDLMKRLAKGGATHAKYRRMINVTMDITAPLFWWKEADTYKVGTVANSCSTMHKIQAKEFTLDDFSCEHLYSEELEKAFENEDALSPINCLKENVKTLNVCRRLYLNSSHKDFWWGMIESLYSSYNQRRTVQLNYEVLSHIYFDRRNHKLDCWHTFCDMIEQLPYAKDIIIVGSKDAESDSEDALKKENEELKKKIEFLEGFIHSYTPGLMGL